MKTKNVIPAIFLATILPFSNFSVAQADTVVEDTPSIESEHYDPEFDSYAQGMSQLLEALDSVPDEVLSQGDESTQKWLDENIHLTSTRASEGACVAAVAGFLAGNIVNVGKVLKVKRLIKDLGGVKEAVKVMWGASFSYEKMKAAGGAIAALADEFFGVKDVRENCFE